MSIITQGAMQAKPETLQPLINTEQANNVVADVMRALSEIEESDQLQQIDFETAFGLVQRLQRAYGKLSAITRKRILSRDNFTCYICGKVPTRRQRTLDHVVPKSRGGTDTPDNLRLACVSCNVRKDNLLLDEFICFLSDSLEDNQQQNEAFLNDRSN